MNVGLRALGKVVMEVVVKRGVVGVLTGVHLC